MGMLLRQRGDGNRFFKNLFKVGAETVAGQGLETLGQGSVDADSASPLRGSPMMCSYVSLGHHICPAFWVVGIKLSV